jgi:ferritin-like metal-binding protein YciE
MGLDRRGVVIRLQSVGISDTAAKTQDRVAAASADLETTIERNPLIAVLTVAQRFPSRVHREVTKTPGNQFEAWELWGHTCSIASSRRNHMASETKSLNDLFHDTLKDIYFAEKRILAALPKMSKAAQSEELKGAFEKHHGETEGLEEVFAIIEKRPQGKTCAAIVGITDEAAEVMKEYKGSPALDAGLLAAAQAVEHYEISRYGTLCTWAEELGLDDARSLLQETLDEEKATDDSLTAIAKTAVNQEAKAA